MNAEQLMQQDTISRQKIVDQTDSNFFVEAGAGSGKTTILVKRMVAMVEQGIQVTDFGMASTPAMFMATVTEGYAFNGTVMITASHLPFNRNGFKYFDKDGKPCDYRGYGYSIKKTEYDEFGRETSISYFDADENPVDIKGPDFEHGYHRVETVYEHGMFTKLSIIYPPQQTNMCL